MLNLYDTLQELEEKGTLLQQAHNLYLEEREYKKLINKYKDNELLCNKYKIRLEHVRNEMMYLNKRIISTLNTIEPYVDVETFVELFGLDYDEWDENEDYYINLLTSSTKIGHVCRQALIQNEKIVKKLI